MTEVHTLDMDRINEVVECLEKAELACTITIPVMTIILGGIFVKMKIAVVVIVLIAGAVIGAGAAIHGYIAACDDFLKYEKYYESTTIEEDD